MNEHTTAARNWLDRRYSRNSGGDYRAHQPIYGIHTERAEPNTVMRFARTYRLIERLHALEFDSVLDVGGGEGYFAAIVRDLSGTSVAHSSDLSVEACRRGSEIFEIHGAAADATRLPFADKSYDLVVCSEVIEHLSRPVAAIAELARIAKRFVVISTSEFCPTGELERMFRGLTLDRSYPHSEVNWFTADDFRGLLGHGVVMGSQYRNIGHLLRTLDWNRERAEKAVALLTSSDGLDVDHAGVIVISARDGSGVPAAIPKLSNERKRAVLDRILEPQIPRHDSADVSSQIVKDSLLARLQCVVCRAAVQQETAANVLKCRGCGRTYELKDGVPSMFLDEVVHDTSKADDACVVTLAADDVARERAVRQVIGKLHHDLRHNGEWVQKSAEQMLRVVWLCYRDEPMSRKITRLIGQLTGRPPVGYDEIRATFQSQESGTGTADRVPRSHGVSEI